MAYLIIGGTLSRCSCDRRSSVDPTSDGHYENYAPDYHNSNEPCGQKYDYYVSTYGIEFKEAVVPWNKDRIG